jgi:hypothetical protein
MPLAGLLHPAADHGIRLVSARYFIDQSRIERSTTEVVSRTTPAGPIDRPCIRTFLHILRCRRLAGHKLSHSILPHRTSQRRPFTLRSFPLVNSCLTSPSREPSPSCCHEGARSQSVTAQHCPHIVGTSHSPDPGAAKPTKSIQIAHSPIPGLCSTDESVANDTRLPEATARYSHGLISSIATLVTGWTRHHRELPKMLSRSETQPRASTRCAMRSASPNCRLPKQPTV